MTPPIASAKMANAGQSEYGLGPVSGCPKPLMDALYQRRVDLTNLLIVDAECGCRPREVFKQLAARADVLLENFKLGLPSHSEVRRDLAPILDRIVDAAGEFHLLSLRKLDPAEEGKLIKQFQDQTSDHYQEIIENCEVNFTKEIEFETFRWNFTYEEA